MENTSTSIEAPRVNSGHLVRLVRYLDETSDLKKLRGPGDAKLQDMVTARAGEVVRVAVSDGEAAPQTRGDALLVLGAAGGMTRDHDVRQRVLTQLRESWGVDPKQVELLSETLNRVDLHTAHLDNARAFDMKLASDLSGKLAECDMREERSGENFDDLRLLTRSVVMGASQHSELRQTVAGDVARTYSET